MICARGRQIIPNGESGIYFICNYGVHKNCQCRYAKWCAESRQYESATDDNGDICEDFTVEDIKPVEIEAKKTIEPVG